MAEAMGDKILLDGIPAVYFLTHHSREEMQACVERLVELFHPRLVLGVADNGRPSVVFYDADGALERDLSADTRR